MEMAMTRNSRKEMPVIANYLLLVVLLGVGGYLLVYQPRLEILGGVILSLTQGIIGILLPLHLKRIHAVEYRFFPAKGDWGKAAVWSAVFTLALLAAGYGSVRALVEYPPDAAAAIFTFLFLLLTAVMYGLLFWGGLLHFFQRRWGTAAAVAATGFLFAAYHLSEFAFTPITWDFLLPMFVSGCVCCLFVLLSGSVLPAVIAQQAGQFVYFLALEENPYAQPAGLIFSLLFLAIGSLVYLAAGKATQKTA